MNEQYLYVECQTKDAESQNLQWNLRAMESKLKDTVRELERLKHDKDFFERRPQLAAPQQNDAGRTSLDSLDHNRFMHNNSAEGGEFETFGSFLRKRRQT